MERVQGHASQQNRPAQVRVGDAEILAERLKVDLLVFVCKSRSAPDDERAGHLREIGRQVGRNAVGEIVLLGIVIEVREWQDDERQAGNDVGPGRSLPLRLLAFGKHVCAERLPHIPVADETTRDRADGGNRGKRPTINCNRARRRPFRLRSDGGFPGCSISDVALAGCLLSDGGLSGRSLETFEFVTVASPQGPNARF